MRKVIFILLAVFPYCIAAQVGFVQEGIASYYDDKFEGRVTASGERYSHLKATCAHVSIPFGSLVRITNLDNNQSAIARVNDRGPFVPDRIIDVSKSVAQRLGMIEKGIANVKIEVIDNQGINVELGVKLPTKNQSENSGSDNTTGTVKEEPKVNDSQNNPTSETAEYFSVEVQKYSKKGFFVQLASFKEQANIFSLLADAQSLYGKKLCVQIANVNGDRLFKVLIGPFGSRADAEKVKLETQARFPGCFIVEIK